MGISYLCPTLPSVANGLKSANVKDTTTPITIHHLPNTAVATPPLHIPEAADFARGLLRLQMYNRLCMASVQPPLYGV